MATKVGNGLDLDNKRILNVADPSAATDATNKQYVDAFVRGLAWKDSVRAASTANFTLSGPGTSIDGVTMATGDRFLAKDQTAGAENGIYVWNGSAVAATRALDADTADDLIGATLTVTEGTVNADRVYRLVTDAVTLGTTALSWTQLGSGGTAYVAGSGLTESPAGTFNVGAGTGITVNADDVALAAAAAGGGLTHTTGVLAVGAGSGITVNADDVALATTAAGGGLTYTTGVLAVGAGAGIVVNADAVALATDVPRKYSIAIGDGTATSYVVTHSLGTQDVVVSVYAAATPFAQIIADVEHTSTTQVTIKFGSAPATNQYRVVVVG